VVLNGDALARAAAAAARPAFEQRSANTVVDPDADIDTSSSTDLEDLLVFLADIAEFLHQEIAGLVATYGEAQCLLVTMGVGGVL